MGRGIAPAGASRGTREAIDLRDGTDALQGKGVQNALNQVNGPIAEMLIGQNANDQTAIDNLLITLDGTPLKSKLGGNAMVATSLAVLHAAAANVGAPLWQYVANQYECAPSIPLPEIQIFGGGAHAGRRVDIQDFMIMVPGANSFDEVMEITNEVYFAAGSIMEKKGNLAGVADEGGWWPVFQSNEEALETLTSAIELAGEKPGERVVISLDVAASEFGQNGKYRFALEDRDMDSGDLIDMLEGWINSYPIASIEDPVGEDDRDGMIEFTRRFGITLQIIGDDYLVTNAGFVETAARDHACNAVLIKVNQAGTVTEAIDTFRQAKEHGWGTIVSARSGETEDVFISHLSTGLGGRTAESRFIHAIRAYGQME
jgi:enolase